MSSFDYLQSTVHIFLVSFIIGSLKSDVSDCFFFFLL